MSRQLLLKSSKISIFAKHIVECIPLHPKQIKRQFTNSTKDNTNKLVRRNYCKTSSSKCGAGDVDKKKIEKILNEEIEEAHNKIFKDNTKDNVKKASKVEEAKTQLHKAFEPPEFLSTEIFRSFSSPEEPLGPNAAKDAPYKNPEYYSYSRYTFTQLQYELMTLRERKAEEAKNKDKKEAKAETEVEVQEENEQESEGEDVFETEKEKENSEPNEEEALLKEKECVKTDKPNNDPCMTICLVPRSPQDCLLDPKGKEGYAFSDIEGNSDDQGMSIVPDAKPPFSCKDECNDKPTKKK